MYNRSSDKNVATDIKIKHRVTIANVINTSYVAIHDQFCSTKNSQSDFMVLFQLN